MNKENKNNRKKAVGWKNPDRMDVEEYLQVGDGEYNGDFVITGVNTRTDGSLVYNSMDDLVTYPYSHGLMTAIEVISQVYSHVECSKVHEENSEFPPLKIRFEANITESSAEITILRHGFISATGCLRTTFSFLKILRTMKKSMNRYQEFRMVMRRRISCVRDMYETFCVARKGICSSLASLSAMGSRLERCFVRVKLSK